MNLRDNFELLEDEHYESMKRFKCLENKIEDLKKTHLMIQTAKVRPFYLINTIIFYNFETSVSIVIQLSLFLACEQRKICNAEVIERI